MWQNSQRGETVDEAVTFAIKLGHCSPAEISYKRSKFMTITPRPHERGHAVTSFHKRSVQRLISSAFASKVCFDSFLFASSSATVSKFSSARFQCCSSHDCVSVRVAGASSTVVVWESDELRPERRLFIKRMFTCQFLRSWSVSLLSGSVEGRMGCLLATICS